MVRAVLLLGLAASSGGCTKPAAKPAPEQERGAGEVAPAPKGGAVPPPGPDPHEAGGEPTSDTKPLSAWIELLGHEDPATRKRAAVALGRMGAAAKPAIPALIRAFSDEQNCAAAVDALGLIGPTAIPDLLEEMKKKEKPLRWRAAIALGRIGPAAKDAVPALVAALKEDEESMVRSAAASSLGQLGATAKDVVPEVVKALRDESSIVRFGAVAGLGGFAEAARSSPELLGVVVTEGVPALTAALRDEDRGMRLQVVVALGLLGPAAKESLPALIEALRDEDRRVRLQASYALGLFGSAAKDALSDLIRAAEQDADEGVRRSASEAVKGIRRR
ncbi:MAG TPA: HEAT repeat domain-containing protein [Fimbriiglobus sp.]|jgi:HEAT repeat protein|nr:HEAT repeat domain-containing protein [Fimbriiglobus sp.]